VRWTAIEPAARIAHLEAELGRDLTNHRCINLRLPGGIYVWEFEKAGRHVNVRVDGQVAVNSSDEMLCAARAGMGIACVLDDKIDRDLADKRLKRVLEDWCPAFPGFHLYYPSRRQTSPAFSLVVDALRDRPAPSGSRGR
jgi:DNA-binding transcriptional LysR family regulator